jgi:hypothetical protein
MPFQKHGSQLMLVPIQALCAKEIIKLENRQVPGLPIYFQDLCFSGGRLGLVRMSLVLLRLCLGEGEGLC